MRSRFFETLVEFFGDRSAVAATEMAFVAPIMILLGLLGVDTANYVIATEQVEQVANTVAQMITTTGPPPAPASQTTGSVTNVDLQFYHDSAALIFPGVLTDAARQGTSWYSDIQISTASIKFTANPTGCTTGCTYTANAIWVAGDNPRPCNFSFNSVPDASVPSKTTLPSDVFGPVEIITVDVAFTYHPLFASFFGAALPIARSVYMSPRYVSEIDYQASSSNPTGGIVATVCS